MLWFALSVPVTQFVVYLHFCIPIVISILELDLVATHIVFMPFAYMKIACTTKYIKSEASRHGKLVRPGKRGRQQWKAESHLSNRH